MTLLLLLPLLLLIRCEKDSDLNQLLKQCRYFEGKASQLRHKNAVSQPLDIHLHEPGDLGAFSMELILERVRAHGMQGQEQPIHGHDPCPGGLTFNKNL